MSLSQSPRQTVDNRGDLEEHIDADNSQYAPDQTRRPSHSSDTSHPLFSLYLRTAEGHHWGRFKLLKGDTDQVLVFCGLFSATVAALIVPSIDNLSPGSVPFILTEILFRLLHPPQPGVPDLEPSSIEFASPTSIVLTNSFWSLSLLLSISCALMALLLRRWVQPPTGVTSTSPRHSLLEQARLRTLFEVGIERHIAFLVEALHALVHIAFAIFLAGLLLFLIDVNNTVFSLAATGIGLSLIVYACLTVWPIYRPGSPYSTPFSNILAIAYAGISRLLNPPSPRNGLSWKDYFRDCYLSSMMFNEAQRPELQLDSLVLQRTFDLLRSDDDLEQFFEAIPGFLASTIVPHPERSFEKLDRKRLEEELVGFWDRTLTSNRVSEYDKGRRLIICLRFIEAANIPTAVPRILHLSKDFGRLLRSVEIGHSLGVLRDGNAALLAQGIIASIISIKNEDDARWIARAKDELKISEDELRRYLKHGDSLLLANLIHITRQFFHSLRQRDSDFTRNSLSILSSLSKFDILNTLPELQHKFCALWNEIVEQAQESWADNKRFIDILVEIRGLYVALHDTDGTLTALAARNGAILRQSPPYPTCTIPGHRNQEAGAHSTATTSRHAENGIQGTNGTSLTSSIAPQSPSGTGSPPRPDKGKASLESPPSTSTNAQGGDPAIQSELTRRLGKTGFSDVSENTAPKPN